MSSPLFNIKMFRMLLCVFVFTVCFPNGSFGGLEFDDEKRYDWCRNETITIGADGRRSGTIQINLNESTKTCYFIRTSSTLVSLYSWNVAIYMNIRDLDIAKTDIINVYEKSRWYNVNDVYTIIESEDIIKQIRGDYTGSMSITPRSFDQILSLYSKEPKLFIRAMDVDGFYNRTIVFDWVIVSDYYGDAPCEALNGRIPWKLKCGNHENSRVYCPLEYRADPYTRYPAFYLSYYSPWSSDCQFLLPTTSEPHRWTTPRYHNYGLPNYAISGLVIGGVFTAAAFILLILRCCAAQKTLQNQHMNYAGYTGPAARGNLASPQPVVIPPQATEPRPFFDTPPAYETMFPQPQVQNAAGTQKPPEPQKF